MLILYVKDNCKFSRRALSAVEALKLTVDVRNRKDPAIAKELYDLQKSYEVPYLVDTERGYDVDESEAIVMYLETYYGNGTTVPHAP